MQADKLGASVRIIASWITLFALICRDATLSLRKGLESCRKTQTFRMTRSQEN